jgi:hypothetical protein
MAPDNALGQSGRLELEGSYSRTRVDRSGQHDTNISLKGTGWPFAVANSGLKIKCRGVFDGTAEAQLRSGRWLSVGEARLADVELSAPAFTDPLRLAAVTAGWDVKATDAGWSVDRLALDSSLASVRALGSVPAVSTRGAWLEADLKLAELARHLPPILRPRNALEAEFGTARLRADLQAGTDGLTQSFQMRATASDVVALPGRRSATTDRAPDVNQAREVDGDITVGATASYHPHSDRIDLTELAVKLPYVQVEGAGAIRKLAGAAQLDLKGTLNPDWGGLTALLAEHVEPAARIVGQPHPWRLSALITGHKLSDALKTLSGDLGIQIDELDVFGIRLGHSALVLRAENGVVRCDPIDATVNQGALHIEPELVRDQDGHIWLRSGKSSTLEQAVINDEVSHRVLAYGAPILDGATRVRGRISVRLGEAVFPVMAPSNAQMRILGNVKFDDVRFMPGRLADQLLTVFDKQDQPLVILRDSISIRIEDRKVHQNGLVIPVANLALIGLNGSVDFGKNLDLVAKLAMNRSAPIAGILPPLLQNARVEIPIRGTLQNPRINTSGFKNRLAGMGVDFVGTTVGAGLKGLERLLEGRSVKRLGDLFRPGARPMTRTPTQRPEGEKVIPEAENRRLPPTNSAEAEAALDGLGNDEGTGECG